MEEEHIKSILDEVEDVFSVGPCSLSRWRQFVDVTQTHPRFQPGWSADAHFTHLAERRAHHARISYEIGTLVELCHPGDSEPWMCAEHLRNMGNVSMLELRTCEVEMFAYLMTTRKVCVRLPHSEIEKLYLATLYVHNAHLFAWDSVSGQAVKLVKGRKDILALRPSRTETMRQLAQGLDENLMGLHSMLRFAVPMLYKDGGLKPLAPVQVQGLVKRLGLMMRAVDNVVTDVS